MTWPPESEVRPHQLPHRCQGHRIRSDLDSARPKLEQPPTGLRPGPASPAVLLVSYWIREQPGAESRSLPRRMLVSTQGLLLPWLAPQARWEQQPRALRDLPCEAIRAPPGAYLWLVRH